MSMLSDIKGFFNDVGTWVNDNVIQPIGGWWDKNIKQPIQNWTVETVKKLEPITKPIRNAVSEGIINNFPLATEEDKQKMRESLKPEMLRGEKAKENAKETEATGNTQKTEATGNTQETETPSIKELWEREDAIRKETQEREDTAYQRAVEDMRKAGVNPNLVGVNPASSGSGIISATGQNLISTEMSGIVSQAIAEINNTVKANENQKDRITDIIRTLAMAMLLKR